MPSRRVPAAHEPNDWTRRLGSLRREGGEVADLTATNPTRLGLAPLAEAAAVLAAAGTAAYEPDARGAPAARAALAGYFGSRGLRVESEDILLTASTSESYAHLFRVLADPGECIAFPSPSYPLFEPLAWAEGIEARTYRLAFDGAWHLDRDSFARAAFGARAIVLVEPNHPTGSCLGAADREFAEATALHEGVPIIADEVFGDHAWPGSAPLPSWLGEPRRVPTFVLGGLSKLCGLPHLKLGWIVATGPEPAKADILSGLEWIADLFLGVSGPVQEALPGLLGLRHGFAARVRERVEANLATLHRLAAERPEVALLPGEGGWSAVLRVPASRTGERWALALLEHGVAIHPGEFYDLEGGEHLVVSLIADPAAMRAGCEALARELRAGG